MSFANPLWLLLLGLLPVIVLLHAISIRWRSTPVSSLVLWQEVVKARAVSLRIRRLLSNAALLLELAAVTALAVSLAGPRVQRAGGGAGNTILVLDATASMQVREGTRSRFDLARSRALEAVAGLRRGDGMAVVLAESSPRLLQPFTRDRAMLQRTLRAARPTDEPGDVAESMLFALSLRDARRGDQVLLLSDGAYESLDGVDMSLPWIHVELVGARHDNVGITGFAFRRTPGGESGYEVFCSVRNAGSKAVSVPLTIRGDTGVVVLSRRLDIPAGEHASLGLPWTGPTEGRVEARIETGDAFPLDDAAYAVFAPARTIRVDLAGPGSYFIQKALESLPGLVVNTSPGTEAAEADVSIYDGVTAPDLEKGNVILFATTPPNLPLRVLGNLVQPAVTGWSRTSPLLESVSLGGLLIGRALSIEPGPGFSVLAASGEWPLILSWEQTGLKVIVVAFDPPRSDFPLRPGFPLFLANAMSWFFPSWLTVQADQVQTGRPRPIAVASPSGSIQVVKPDGTRRILTGSDESREFLETDEAGFYRVESGSTVSEFAASLTSDIETDITPRLLATDSGGARGVARIASSAVPIWPLIAGLALVFLLAEWVVWARPSRRQRP